MPPTPEGKAYVRIWVDFANNHLMRAGWRALMGREEGRAEALQAYLLLLRRLDEEIDAKAWRAINSRWPMSPTRRSLRGWLRTSDSTGRCSRICKAGGNASACVPPTWPQAAWMKTLDGLRPVEAPARRPPDRRFREGWLRDGGRDRSGPGLSARIVLRYRARAFITMSGRAPASPEIPFRDGSGGVAFAEGEARP